MVSHALTRLNGDAVILDHITGFCHENACLGFLLDKFDAVPIGVLYESDFGCTTFYGTRFSADAAASGFNGIAGAIDIAAFNGDVAVGIAVVVLVCIPVVGQFDDGCFTFFSIA